MTFQTERDLFIMAVVGGMTTPVESKVPAYVIAKKLLRHAQTLHRLAVAQCNGDWPVQHPDRNGPWIPCHRCDTSWHHSVMRKDRNAEVRNGWVGLVCPDCRTQDAVRELLTGTPFMPVFGGDPRGAVLKLAPVGATRENIDNGTARLLCVPVRER